MAGHEDIVREALDALNRHDVDGYVACCAPDIVTTNELGVVIGTDDTRASVGVFDSMTEHWRRIERVIVLGDNVAVWLTFGGTVRSTGRTFEVEGVSVFGIEDGRIRSVTEFIEFAPVIAAFS